MFYFIITYITISSIKTYISLEVGMHNVNFTVSSFFFLHQCYSSCFYSAHGQLYNLSPELSLSTWIVKEAAAGSSTSQNSSPLVGTTRAAGNAGPSRPSSTSCMKMVTGLQCNSYVMYISSTNCFSSAGWFKKFIP